MLNTTISGEGAAFCRRCCDSNCQISQAMTA